MEILEQLQNQLYLNDNFIPRKAHIIDTNRVV